MEPKSEEQDKIYKKKKVCCQNLKDSNTTLDLVSDEIPTMIQNFGYCLTTANEHSIIHDIITDNILQTNFINDSIDFESSNIAQRKELSQKIIGIIEDTINSKVSNKKIFPFYHFRRGFRIVFYNQLKKINDFDKEFYPFYFNHLLTEMLSKDPLTFKIIKRFKVRRLMALFSYPKKARLLNKQIKFSKDSNLYKSKNRPPKMKPVKKPTNPTVTLELMTKIPNKNNEKMKNNKQLELAYCKAKEATVGIRRIEYAHNMMIGLKFNQEQFQIKIKIIQRWWRSILRCYYEFDMATRIQSKYRANLSRIVMYDTCRLIDDVLPFLYRVDNIMARNKIEYFFNQLYRKYAYLSISRKLDDQIDLIKRNIKSYIMRKRQLKEFSKPFATKCSMVKFICEISTKEKIDMLQSSFRFFLMNNNEKIMYNYAHDVHPHLYYRLKYKRKTPIVYKKKIVKFRKFVNKFKLLNLKANKGINNMFDYLRVILLRKPFNNLKLYHKQYIFKRKNGLLNKFLYDLHNKTKLKRKYFDRWKYKANQLKSSEQCLRLTKLVNDVLIPQGWIHLRKYFNLWRRKMTLIYKIVSLYHKKKHSDKNLFVHRQKTKCFKDLFDEYNILRPGQKERELRNAMKRWKDKISKIKERDNKLANTVLKRTENNKAYVKKINMLKLGINCKANKREDIIRSLLNKKSTKDNITIRKYYYRWKKLTLNKLLTSVLNKTLFKTKTINNGKLAQWFNKAKALNDREQSLKDAINSNNNRKLLEMALDKFRKKTNQVKDIEASMRSLVIKTSNKNNETRLQRYVTLWKFKTQMGNIMLNLQKKKLNSLFDKWKRHKQSIHLLNTFIQKKQRMEGMNLRKYFDRWRNYNTMYKRLILPLYQTKLKLFSMILNQPFDKRKFVAQSEVLKKIGDKANENKKNILSNLKKTLMRKHTINVNDQLKKWKDIKDNIVSKEDLTKQRETSIKDIFNAHTLRCSNINLQKYFTIWRKKVGYHLRNCLIKKTNQNNNQLRLYLLHWKKRTYRYKLHKASSKIISRVKSRNNLRELNMVCNNKFIKKLKDAAALYNKRSQIKKVCFKNLFSVVKSNMNFTNAIKGLIKIAPIANRQFRLYFLKWKIQMRRIIITQRRFYNNVNRRLITNEKKSLMTNLVKKAGKRAQQMKGGFFKNYKKAAGVYYVKCSKINLQVFFLYRQKKYLSKRKYRMLKYVINKVNTKLLKHQSLKRFIRDWIRIIRFYCMIDCLNKRLTLLDKGEVALRYGVRKWFYTS